MNTTQQPAEPGQRGKQQLRMVAGVLAVLLGLHFAIARPLAKRVDSLAAELAATRAQLDALAGSQSDAWKTNDLLTAMSIQRKRIGDAADAVAQVDALAGSIDAIAARLDDAHTAVARVERLEDKIAAATIDIDALIASVADLQRLNGRVSDLSVGVEQRMNDVDTAIAHLDDLELLKDRIVDAGPAIDKALGQADDLTMLTSRLADAAARIDAADATAEGLIGLASRMIEEGPSVLEAAANLLDGMAGAGAAVERQTEVLIGLVNSTETVQEFQEELNRHVSGMRDMQRELVNLAVLETSFGRVAAALAPIADLGELRNLQIADFDAAAVELRRQRMARTATEESPLTPLLSAEESSEDTAAAAKANPFASEPMEKAEQDAEMTAELFIPELPVTK